MGSKNRLNTGGISRAALAKFFVSDRLPSDEQLASYFEKTCFIVSAPRSGSTLLIELLALGLVANVSLRESHAAYQIIAHTDASWSVNKVDADTARRFRQALYGIQYLDGKITDSLNSLAFVEKTPRHLVSLPFLKAVFPRAHFVFLYRDPVATIASMIEAWLVSAKTGQFVTYRQLPGWHLPHWCFVLLPNWRQYIGATVVEIVVAQWLYMMRIFLSDSAQSASETLMAVSYADLISAPADEIAKVARHIGTPMSADPDKIALTAFSATTVTAPDPTKQGRYSEQLRPYMDEINAVDAQLQAFVARYQSGK